MLPPLIFHHGLLTLSQRNILVDNNGIAYLGGLGSISLPSFPAGRPDIRAGSLFCGSAPEIINPRAFGLAYAQNTKATDMFAFGILAWEVNRVLCLVLLMYSSTDVDLRFLLVSPHLLGQFGWQ